MLIRIISLAMMSSLLWGCSSAPIKYQNNLEKNLTINLRLDDMGGLFSSVDVVAGVNDLDSRCEPHYRGMIEIKPGENKLGLAPGVLTYLQVDIAHKRPGQSSLDSRGTMIKPVSGKKYQVEINYIDDMYDFRLFEISGVKRKPLKLKSVSKCRKG